MKKTILLIAVLVLGINGLEAQNKFGLTSGVNLSFAKTEFGDESENVNDTGFFIGAFADFGLNEKSGVRAELDYGRIEGGNILYLPILYRYELTDGLHLMAGPQVNYILEESVENLTNFGLGLTAGLSYNVAENVGIMARFSNQINNSYTGDIDNVSVRINYFQAGLTYTFN